MTRKRNLPIRTLALVGLLLWLLTACAAPPAPAAQPASQAPSSGESAAAPAKITIKLAENPWTGSQVNVAVAKQLLEKELGYTVEIISIDENAQWPALSNGDLSASLEVWPSGHAENIAQYIDDQKVVENAGELGVVGRIGWYEPSYVAAAHPELATWEGFKNPELAGLFKTAETGDKGQFLSGDPSWVQYDESIVENLGLDLQVTYAGSEEAIVAALDSAYSREEPVLFYFWTPHSIFARYDLTRVSLPDYSDECYAKASSGGVDCDYPPDTLFKIVWAGLKDAAPDAYHLLHNFSYSTDDQIAMIAAVEVDGKSIDEAAAAWIAANESVWQGWVK
jgi:glycine betaine/proline transport system substrate-binding protein